MAKIFTKSKYSPQECFCSTKAVCQPNNEAEAKAGLDSWKKSEEVNGKKVMYRFSSSRKVNRR
jgi:hypothetical protein